MKDVHVSLAAVAALSVMFVMPSHATTLNGKWGPGYFRPEAPLGIRWWLNEKLGLDGAIGFTSDDASETGGPISGSTPASRSCSRAWVTTRSSSSARVIRYASTPLPTGLEPDNKQTSLGLTGTLGVEHFFTDRFSVQVAHGVIIDSVDRTPPATRTRRSRARTSESRASASTTSAASNTREHAAERFTPGADRRRSAPWSFCTGRKRDARTATIDAVAPRFGAAQALREPATREQVDGERPQPMSAGVVLAGHGREPRLGVAPYRLAQGRRAPSPPSTAEATPSEHPRAAQVEPVEMRGACRRRDRARHRREPSARGGGSSRAGNGRAMRRSRRGPVRAHEIRLAEDGRAGSRSPDGSYASGAPASSGHKRRTSRADPLLRPAFPRDAAPSRARARARMPSGCARPSGSAPGAWGATAGCGSIASASSGASAARQVLGLGCVPLAQLGRELQQPRQTVRALETFRPSPRECSVRRRGSQA